MQRATVAQVFVYVETVLLFHMINHQASAEGSRTEEPQREAQGEHKETSILIVVLKQEQKAISMLKSK